MDKFVANLNTSIFRKQLAEETDEVKRLMLVRLLAEEEAKLAGLPTSRQQFAVLDAVTPAQGSVAPSFDRKLRR
jgi:hypothetical protein